MDACQCIEPKKIDFSGTIIGFTFDHGETYNTNIDSKTV